MEKYCTKCKKLKDIYFFYNRSDKPHLLRSECKDCVIKKTALNIEKDKEKKLLRDRKYHQANRDKRIAYSATYNENNKAKKNEYFKNRYHSDLNFRITTNVRNRVRIALKRNSKSNATEILIGCNLDFLKLHLEKMFKDGMTWSNYGEWQIDHIYPCSKFDLSKPEEQSKCFHYSNLQPLWKKENREKSNNILIEKEVCYR